MIKLCATVEDIWKMYDYYLFYLFLVYFLYFINNSYIIRRTVIVVILLYYAILRNNNSNCTPLVSSGNYIYYWGRTKAEAKQSRNKYIPKYIYIYIPTVWQQDFFFQENLSTLHVWMSNRTYIQYVHFCTARTYNNNVILHLK